MPRTANQPTETALIYIEISVSLQANVYKIMLECWNANPNKRPTFEFLAHMFEDFNVTTQNQYMEG